MEVILTSDAFGQLWNCSVWDPRIGTSLFTYKGGGISSPRCLGMLGKDYIITAEKLKPLIHIWPINSHEMVQSSLRFVCPGRVNALTSTPDGKYIVASVMEKIHIWQVGSGQMLGVVARHFQCVTCLAFTDDGSHFISAGEDGMVFVWPLAYIISHYANELLLQSEAGQTDPRYTFSDHCMPVTDLYVGKGGMKARFITVSVDRTCRVYDLSSGTLLINLIFNTILSCVAVNPNETNVFVGNNEGKILTFNLQNVPRNRDYHFGANNKEAEFVGHSKGITCLSVSLDGTLLLSASVDEKVMIWDIVSKQCMKVIQHKAPVTNAFFTVISKTAFDEGFKPSLVLHSFQRGSETENINSTVDIINLYEPEALKIADVTSDTNLPVQSNTLRVSDLEQEIQLLKQANSALFKFTAEKILKSISEDNETANQNLMDNKVAPAVTVKENFPAFHKKNVTFKTNEKKIGNRRKKQTLTLIKK